ncbi:MAG: NADH-quinone oxidoreductase subunit G, partial [Acidithiobacillaceae bacterium]|nr:NADH-quinone oxidoreductase subunit G [Acidithiobacillaceae bacterium]
SVCPHCAVGCNTTPGARLGTLRRIRNRQNPEINGHFLCDRGRYAFPYVTAHSRPLQPRLKGETSRQEAVLRQLASRLEEGRSGFLGSPREDLQSNLGLFALADCLHAPFAAVTSSWAEALAQQCLALPQAPSLQEVAAADRIVVIGDLDSIAPMAGFAVRQALGRGARLTVLASSRTGLARKGDYRPLRPSALPDVVSRLADDPCLQGGRLPVLLATAETLGPAGLFALRKTLEKLPANARAGAFVNRPNLFGAAYFAADGHTERLQQALRQREIHHLLCLGADPLGEDWGAGTWRTLSPGLDGLALLDMVDSQTARAAEALLPVAAFPERAGLFVNYEGRIQAFAPVYRREAQVLHSAVHGSAFPEAAGGMKHPLGPPPPLFWLGRLAELLQVHEAWQQRLDFYLHFLCPTAPDPESPGVLLPDTLRARFAIAALPTTPTVESGQWELDIFRWYGGETLADTAEDLQSLAPLRGLRVHPDVQAEWATLQGPCGQLHLPVIPCEDMVQGVIAIDQEGFAELGLYPGDPVEVTWEQGS